jgi:hypothetical protein
MSRIRSFDVVRCSPAARGPKNYPQAGADLLVAIPGPDLTFREGHTSRERSRDVAKMRGLEVRGWLRQRRERAERIEDEADELIRLRGDGAYAEARRREHTASSSATAKEWNLIALAIASQTGKRIGLDLSTRMAMNAVFVPDREPDGRTPRPSVERVPVDELKRIVSAKSQLFRIQFLCAAPTGLPLLKEVEVAATSVSDAIVSAARFTLPPKTVSVRILDHEGQIVFERHRAARK